MSNSLHMPDDDRCALCDYLSGYRPYTILWRELRVAVLVTREQRGVSHLLVIPRRHVPSLLELRTSEAGDLMVAVRDAARAISDVAKSPGIAVWQNNGIPANQAVGHLHFHVAGTLPGGGTEFGPVPELPIIETDDIASRLASGVLPRPSVVREVRSSKP